MRIAKKCQTNLGETIIVTLVQIYNYSRSCTITLAIFREAVFLSSKTKTIKADRLRSSRDGEPELLSRSPSMLMLSSSSRFAMFAIERLRKDGT